jgi:acetate kinase
MKSVAEKSILAVNTGSSSVKFQLFAHSPALELLAHGEVENIGSSPSLSTTEEKTKHTETKVLPANSTFENVLGLILDWTTDGSQNWQVIAVAHRIVHGGDRFKESVLVTPAVMQELKKLIPFAPYHQPRNLEGIKIIRKIHPEMPQIACFDTAFHSGRDPLFTDYALPKKIRDQGIRRYGFHGLSYEWIAHSLRQTNPKLAAGRIIAAHLGNGASTCGMQNGISVDTSLGLTAVEGLPMGTRCGTLDPGAVIYMIRDLAMSEDDVEHILYTESGLLGLSGSTNNVKILQESTNADAQFALEYFCLRAAQFMGEMAVAIGGVDGIVFTGGIGENSGPVRDKILARLEFMKPFEVLVIPANEERIMAMQAQTCIEQTTGDKNGK